MSLSRCMNNLHISASKLSTALQTARHFGRSFVDKLSESLPEQSKVPFVDQSFANSAVNLLKMEEIDDFFDFSKPFKRVTVQAGYINGRTTTEVGMKQEILKREDIGREYAKVYQEAEERKILQNMDVASTSEMSTYLDQLDDMEETAASRPKVARTDLPLYSRYNFETRSDGELPIHGSRPKIVEAIRDNRVIILQGDTGCGKTTQVPQFILEDCYKRREFCNIVCTQPRRIAAISIARRVCQERKWNLGDIISYQVGLHSTVGEDTRLLYCTTGILLQKLIVSKDMSTYTHVILDEVHERDQDMDFLLFLVRRLLTSNSPHVKVVLMSATIDAKEFSDYFKIMSQGTLVPAPVLSVDSRRLFTVKDFYLCQLDRLMVNVEVNYDEPGISEEMYKIALKLIVICEKLDSQDEEVQASPIKPSILIFLPGINEIERMEKTLQRLENLKSDIKLLPLRLHSMISQTDQEKIFLKPPPNCRKVILSTNIAESSITVPDVKYVIDFCLTKSLVTDTSTNLSALQLHWASRSSCRQRAGRAGRVSNGRVYRLVSKHFYETMMDEYGSPEMVRCPLENVVLKAKLLDMGRPEAILALVMTPPDLSDIRNTILILKEIGALYRTVAGNYDPYDGDLTFVGRVMASLPIDVRISRLIIFGSIFSVLEETIIMAAGLNVKSIFEYPHSNGLNAYSQKLTWSDGSGSDLFAILKAYRVWHNMKEQNNFEDDDSEKVWARRYFINTRLMREVNLLVREITDRLSRVGIKETVGVNRVRWTEREKTIVLKIAIAGAFYPNYFLRTSFDHHQYERDAYQVLSGRNPCNTVYFMNFDQKYIGQLYTQSIKDLFKQVTPNTKNLLVNFEEGAQKVFVTFPTDSDYEHTDAYNLVQSVPGRVRPEVYKAVKMRQLRYDTTIRVMDPREAVAYAEKLNLGVMRDGKWIPRKKQLHNPELAVIPSVYIKNVRGYVTHIEHCGKFWFQPLSEEERLREITEQLNGPCSSIHRFTHPSQVSKGMILAAPFFEKGGRVPYYRARVVNLVNRGSHDIFFRVLFIDYGSYGTIEFRKLRKFGNHADRLTEIPPRVFECYLTEVQPSSINCPRGRWIEEANELMQNFVDNGICEVEVYSIVNGIVSVILERNGTKFNDILVQRGWAQYAEENYMSKCDHDSRMRKQRSMKMSEEDDLVVNEDYLRKIQGDEDVYTDPPPATKCRNRVELRGPHSALETGLYCATRIGGWKTVTIESQSVNSVLLDTDPHDYHERLVVAASVTETLENNKITARATTLMPNIHGFAPLMGLIFCPTMEIKRDASKTRYVSVLCGLGADRNNHSIFEEHDIVFNLDIEITPNDIELINQIRYSMESLLYTDPGQEFPTVPRNDKAELAAKIKNLIVKLLEKPRKSIEVHRDHKEHLWNQYDEEDLLETVSVYGHRSIFPFHKALRLYGESFEHMQTLRSQNDELHRMAEVDTSMKPLRCVLCDRNLETVIQLRIHLLSQLHRDREYQIGYKPTQ